MNNKTYTLRFAVKNKKIYEYIKEGKKKVETRAATPKYLSVKKGDILVLACAGKKFKKEIKKVSYFKNITALLKKYSPNIINPGVKTLKETEAIYYSFPGYKEKIKQYGLVAFELFPNKRVE